MSGRIFVSVPDGPYWRAKEERERAEAANRRKQEQEAPAAVREAKRRGRK